MSCIPTSSNCVTYEGPAIDCLEQCSPENITSIIYKLGQLVCGLSKNDCDCDTKIPNTTFTCIPFDSGEEITFTAEEALAGLVQEFYCNGQEVETVITYSDMMTKTTESYDELTTLIPLPTCLQYDDAGETITELPYREYIILLADTICLMWTAIGDNATAIGNLETEVTAINAWIAAYKPPDPTTIVSQCASHTTPGTTVEISTAFETLETYLCAYVTSLGTTTDWTNAISFVCASLKDEPQMGDLSLVMSDITGWIDTPGNVSETYSNLWLSVCDLRSGLQTLLESNAADKCVLAAPENLAIDSHDLVSAEISWTASSLADIQDPTSYLLEVYQYIGGIKGNLVYTTSYTGVTVAATLTSINIIADANYLIELTAVYSCGSSNPLTVDGVLKDSVILNRINVSEVSDSGVTTNCDPGTGAVAHPYVTNTMTFDLVNLAGTASTLLVDLIIMVTFSINHPDYGIITQNVPVTLPAGDSTVDYEYVSLQTILAIAGTCSDIVKTLNCGLLLSDSSCEFGTGITAC